MSVCCLSPFHWQDFEAYFVLTSQSQMSNTFRDSESLRKSAGKKWSQNWPFLLGSGLKSAKKKFFCWFCFTNHGGNHPSRWIRDLWSKGLSLILAYLWTSLSFFFGYFFFFFCILGPPYCGISATIRIGWEIRCPPYAGFLLRFLLVTKLTSKGHNF